VLRRKEREGGNALTKSAGKGGGLRPWRRKSTGKSRPRAGWNKNIQKREVPPKQKNPPEDWHSQGLRRIVSIL